MELCIQNSIQVSDSEEEGRRVIELGEAYDVLLQEGGRGLDLPTFIP